MRSDDKPWLSVVLPVHNGEQWVGAALESIAIQADPGLEVVVIDTSDGPATRAIVDSYADRLHLRVIDPAGAEGCVAKTNLGVSEARADHISWLCQDDVWLSGRTEAVRNWIREDPQTAFHMAPAVIVDRAGRELGIWRCPLSENDAQPSQEQVLSKLLVQNFLFAASMVVRRDAWLATGGLKDGLWYTADWDLWLKLVRHGPTRFHGQITAGFRIHNQSTTAQFSRFREEFIVQQDSVVDEHLKSLHPALATRVRRLARASARINADLAEASAGHPLALLRAAWQAVRLGPLGFVRYFQASRILERALPRLRARLAGVF